MLVEKLKEKDIDYILILNAQNLNEIQNRQQIFFLLRRKEVFCYKAVDEGNKIVGYILSCLKDSELNIFSFLVVKEFRGEGVGTLLMNKVEEAATKNGKVNTMNLFVRKANKKAIKFYKKYGFVIKEEIEDYYTIYKTDNGFSMEKKLTN